MREIPLSAFYRSKNSGLYVAIVDEDDYEWLSLFNWNANVRRDSTGCPYVRARRTDRSSGYTEIIDMHRVIWENARGPIPAGMTVDHVEHGSFGALDNRKNNLRLASRKDQQGNRRKSKRALHSQWKGVQFVVGSGRWVAAITINLKTTYIGTFQSETEAAKAYDVAAREHFGEFASLNFPADREAA